MADDDDVSQNVDNSEQVETVVYQDSVDYSPILTDIYNVLYIDVALICVLIGLILSTSIISIFNRYL